MTIELGYGVKTEDFYILVFGMDAVVFRKRYAKSKVQKCGVVEVDNIYPGATTSLDTAMGGKPNAARRNGVTLLFDYDKLSSHGVPLVVLTETPDQGKYYAFESRYREGELTFVRPEPSAELADKLDALALAAAGMVAEGTKGALRDKPKAAPKVSPGPNKDRGQMHPRLSLDAMDGPSSKFGWDFPAVPMLFPIGYEDFLRMMAKEHPNTPLLRDPARDYLADDFCFQGIAPSPETVDQIILGYPRALHRINRFTGKPYDVDLFFNPNTPDSYSIKYVGAREIFELLADFEETFWNAPNPAYSVACERIRKYWHVRSWAVLHNFLTLSDEGFMLWVHYLMRVTIIPKILREAGLKDDIGPEK